MLELTVSGILADLKAGKNRKEIGEKYGLNVQQIKELFKNEHLRGRRTIKEKGTSFVLIDDLSVNNTEHVETVHEEIVEHEVIEEVEEDIASIQPAPVVEENIDAPVNEQKLWE